RYRPDQSSNSCADEGADHPSGVRPPSTAREQGVSVAVAATAGVRPQRARERAVGMSDPGSSTSTSRRAMVKPGLLVVVRILLSVSVLFAAYYLLPIRNKGQGSDVPWLLLEMAVFAVVVGIQVPAIVNAKYP